MYSTTAKRDKKGRIVHQVRQAELQAAISRGSSFCSVAANHNRQKGQQAHTLPALVQELQSKELPSTRIQPDRRWFGNTRVIGQSQLERFREEMGTKVC